MYLSYVGMICSSWTIYQRHRYGAWNWLDRAGLVPQAVQRVFFRDDGKLYELLSYRKSHFSHSSVNMRGKFNYNLSIYFRGYFILFYYISFATFSLYFDRENDVF